MFFRRRKPRTLSFSERLDGLKQAGFTVSPLPGGGVRVARGECAIDLKDDNGTARAEGAAGVLHGSEIATLVDGGYQKFFGASSGKRRPATAGLLSALHDFEEDLREGLGEESYYNEALGTVSTTYIYDRLTDRDKGVPKRVWE